uniref:Uncharacterized protein n=1 Tax=Anguilla anguilla TaxID=7936 RepID=A0A0E9WFG4_ANGAN
MTLGISASNNHTVYSFERCFTYSWPNTWLTLLFRLLIVEGVLLKELSGQGSDVRIKTLL